MSGIHANGRAERVQRHLLEKGSDTVRGCVIACEPGCSQSNMAASLSSLVKAGKLTAKLVSGITRYYPTPDALIDRRKVKKPAPKPKAKKPNGTAAHSKPRRTAIDQEAKAAQARRAPIARFCSPIAAIIPARPANADPETVDEFLRRGGQVQQLPQGATGQPFAHIGHEAINQASWRARVRSHDDELAA